MRTMNTQDAQMNASMRKALDGTIFADEEIIGVWTRRGAAPQTLVCTDTRVLLVKRTFSAWQVTAIPLVQISAMRQQLGRFAGGSWLVFATSSSPMPTHDYSDACDGTILAHPLTFVAKRALITDAHATIERLRKS